LLPFSAQEPIQVQRFEPVVRDVEDGFCIDARVCEEVAKRLRQAVCFEGGRVEGDHWQGMAVGHGTGRKGRRRTVSSPSGGSEVVKRRASAGDLLHLGQEALLHSDQVSCRDPSRGPGHIGTILVDIVGSGGPLGDWGHRFVVGLIRFGGVGNRPDAGCTWLRLWEDFPVRKSGGGPGASAPPGAGSIAASAASSGVGSASVAAGGGHVDE
jgi:hypothetical protein